MKLFGRTMAAEATSLSRQDVIAGFRWILGRDPESEEVVTQHMSLGTMADLRRALLQSEEFGNSTAMSVPHAGYQPDANDVALLNKYRTPHAPVPGAVVDFLGTETSIAYNNATERLDGVVEGVPVKGNFHSGPVEWLGLLRSVDEAKGRFAMAEFGAGWAPWLVAGGTAARLRGITEIRLIGVEADDGHFGYMKDHLSRNGFDPDEAALFQAAVSSEEGVAMFPDIDSKEDWGAAASLSSERPSRDYRGRAMKFKEVKARSPATILDGVDYLDLCHIDIQGAERDVICNCLDVFTSKVRRIVVGTHSRSIEGALFDTLSAAGWLLEMEEPCQFVLPKSTKPIDEAETVKDGTQVWLNLCLK
jgi:FkbM family methyltransferase